LIIAKGMVAGTITFTLDTNKYPCTVLSGSTDKHGKLMLNCLVFGVDAITLIGTLKLKTGTGSGTFSDSFYREKGTYTNQRRV
jgi:hypothetical protein